MRRFRAVAAAKILTFATLAIAWPARAATFTLHEIERGVTVKLDGTLFTEYLIRSGNKPILWPISGPGGVRMTRDYPMENTPGESHDHPHHRSLWFTHGSVNGIDFWGESADGGEIRHRKFTNIQSGTVGRIVALDDWLDHAGRRICQDRRTLVFRDSDDRRSIDFDIHLIARDGRVVFRDTKEGSFGLRVADWLKVDPPGHGQIVNSRGQTNANAWGQRASWVDYHADWDEPHAPRDSRTLGIAILNHPSSFRYPTYWHVRTYGLFAANPFGHRSLSGSKNTVDGSVALDPGQSLTLRYRVILHRGDQRQAHIAEAFAEYSKEQIND